MGILLVLVDDPHSAVVDDKQPSIRRKVDLFDVLAWELIGETDIVFAVIPT